MKHDDTHLSDEQLMLEIDGEVSAHQAKQNRAHLEACWKCRTRRQELESGITSFVRVYHQSFDQALPPIAGPRALLKAHLESSSKSSENMWARWIRFLRYPACKTAATAFVLLLAVFFSREGYLNRAPFQNAVVSTPNSKLTPGATLLIDRQAVCALTTMNNKSVPAALQKRVFEEYGLARAETRAYEVDYLVTPALGGADDIRNLWPQSYATTAWDAKAKDALEQRLRDMVCNGSLDLTEAQHEIAANWIATYKKYFQTDLPVVPR
jgi:hypothetical protein